MLAGPPSNQLSLPTAVETLIAGRPYEIVWLNQIGGLTIRVLETPGSAYLKWAAHSSDVDFVSEVVKLKWASTFTHVPVVIDQGFDNEGTWLVTEGIEAENAVSARWKQDPRTATEAIAAGLRALHEALPVENCPYSWAVDERLGAIEKKASAGGYANHAWSNEFVGLTIESALEILRIVPEADLVVCHGDACAPNTLIGDDGSWVAHVDLGDLGVGDRWADLAVASWSTVWNYGPGWEMNVYASYGLAPDPDKIRYYRLLWELG